MLLEDNKYCFVCGKSNPYGLKLSFSYADGKISSEFTPAPMHQGYKDITHGGIIASILDEAMIQAALSEGITPVTAEINVRFRKPLAMDRKTVVEAEITKKGSRLLEARSRLLDSADGAVIAEANAKLIR
ncbi:MAG: PaaI family thioesterase [Nitrospirae bacterium]|nr:PaaI family thioesterase [Nitrospirota bacterium]MCL5236873.1 PaaI family thioesterase [Nitrospirota bacterium]